MTWLFVLFLTTLEVLLFNKRHILTTFDDKLALGFVALIFSGGYLYLNIDKFNPEKFCLMNQNDLFCEGSDKSNCFTKYKNSVFAENFGFGGFMEIGSGLGFL